MNEEIQGTIEKVLFRNRENGYLVATLRPKGGKEEITVVGTMPEVQPGESVRCLGEWKHHLAYGKQYIVHTWHTLLPATAEAIRKYLGSGMIPGIGRKYAERIVEYFGDATLQVIDQEPERLLEIEGMGKKRMASILASWQEQKSIRHIMIFLQGHGISTAYAQKIFRRYGMESIRLVQENPYRLAREVHGIGFRLADELAQQLGLARNAKERIDAGIEFTLQELSSEGHTCYPYEALLQKVEEIISVTQEEITSRIEALRDEKRLAVYPMVWGGRREVYVWLGYLYSTEISIGRDIHRLLQEKSTMRGIDTKAAIEWVERKLALHLAPQQKKAVASVFEKKLQIITGGPGTGKSTITRAILTIAEVLEAEILLAAPTGRAAKRMQEITGRKASTLHALLEVGFATHQCKRNQDNPLECDLLIIDEASMIDTYLMGHLLRAVPSHARVVFVGDVFQLPSVGPGNVLKDLILSGILPTVQLTEIFRQAAGSKIITTAHQINQGQIPFIENHAESDFFFLERGNPEQVLETIIQLVTMRLPQRYGLDPVKEIQVLAPMRKGIIGIHALNDALQQRLNNKKPILRMGMRLAVGDKVMQVKNNPQKGLSNGDVGFITDIDEEEEEIAVLYDQQSVVYSYSELDEIVLAYAVSVHKYQGSECPCIVMPLHTTHAKLLYRNLLYTGITRGKRLVILVGTKRALILAVKNDEVRLRYTGLLSALSGGVPLW